MRRRENLRHQHGHTLEQETPPLLRSHLQGQTSCSNSELALLSAGGEQRSHQPSPPAQLPLKPPFSQGSSFVGKCIENMCLSLFRPGLTGFPCLSRCCLAGLPNNPLFSVWNRRLSSSEGEALSAGPSPYHTRAQERRFRCHTRNFVSEVTCDAVGGCELSSRLISSELPQSF